MVQASTLGSSQACLEATPYTKLTAVFAASATLHFERIGKAVLCYKFNFRAELLKGFPFTPPPLILYEAALAAALRVDQAPQRAADSFLRRS